MQGNVRHSRIARRAGLVVLPLAMIAAQPALAHVGFGAHGFAAGAAHPVTGLDHMLAMVVVGVIAARAHGMARLAPLLAFVGAMVIGGAAGLAGLALPDVMVEGFIALSLVVMGGLLALSLQVGAGLLLPGIALFGAFHGVAHGAEAPMDASGLSYLLGFVATTALLHLTGIVTGLLLRRLPAPREGLLRAGIGLGCAAAAAPTMAAAMAVVLG